MTIEVAIKVLTVTRDYFPFVMFSAISFALGLNAIKRRAYFIALSMLLIGVFLVVFGRGVALWGASLSNDSFLEVLRFGFDEARFWLLSFFQMAPQLAVPISKTLVFIFCQAALLTLGLYKLLQARKSVERLYVVVLAAGLAVISIVAWLGFENGRRYIGELKAGFSTPPSGITWDGRRVDLFVYIGESISTLNLQLYGYPLPTTPRLLKWSEDPGFLRFERVRSTHTHTSPSLLRSLAVSVAQADERVVYWGLGAVLSSVGATASLYSSQPPGGSFELVEDLVFGDMRVGDISVTEGDSKLSEGAADHRVLGRALKDSGVVVFHSYAGHGPYESNIDPRFSSEVPGPGIGFTGMYGSAMPHVPWTNTDRNKRLYDRAMTYVDYNVATALDNVRSKASPAALVFFSDHGEAVYANRGHDSSRFIDEMVTVPVVVYFNEAYRRLYPSTYQKFRSASLKAVPRLLDQITPSILEILGIGSVSGFDVPSLASGWRHPRPFILRRESVFDRSEIRVDYSPSSGIKSKFRGGTPEPTYISIVNDHVSSMNSICYHRANSYAKALRGASVAGCLEVDLVVDGESLHITHPPVEPTGFDLQHVVDIVANRGKSVWIDGKNLDSLEACRRLSSFTAQHKGRVREFFVEFPSRTIEAGERVLGCAQELRKSGVRTSYYVPTGVLYECKKGGVDFRSRCGELRRVLDRAASSGAFSDFSFDYMGYAVMRALPEANRLRWNTWGLAASDFHMIPARQFDYVILDSSTDPNSQ